MRPRRSMPVASTTTSAAPELASMPRWLMCQSDATPSSALYWHMGETTMRFASSRSASLMGENRALVMSHVIDLRPGGSEGEPEGMAQPVGSARDNDYDVQLARDARPRTRGNSSRRAAGRIGALSLLGRHFIRRRRRDLGPSLAQPD